MKCSAPTAPADASCETRRRTAGRSVASGSPGGRGALAGGGRQLVGDALRRCIRRGALARCLSRGARHLVVPPRSARHLGGTPPWVTLAKWWRGAVLAWCQTPRGDTSWCLPVVPDTS